MIYVTSFNKAIYEHRGRAMLDSLVPHVRSCDKVIAYHENSYEQETLEPAGHDGKVEFRDIFEEVPSLREVVERPAYVAALNSPIKEVRFLNYHAQFFARKVASIWAASLEKSQMCWVDADCIVSNKVIDRFKIEDFSQHLEGLLDGYHIAHKQRGWYPKHNCYYPSETSFLLLDATCCETLDFISHWWNLYYTGAVHHLRIWADANVFDFCQAQFTELVYRNLFADKFAWKCFHHRLGHKEMANKRKAAKLGLNSTSDKYLIIGSAPGVDKWLAGNLPWFIREGYQLVTLNNSWKLLNPALISQWHCFNGHREYGTYIPTDYEKDLMGLVIKHRTKNNYRHMYLNYRGGTMFLNALYYLLQNSKPKEIVCVGCDMIYDKEGDTFYSHMPRSKASNDPLKRWSEKELEKELQNSLEVARNKGCALHRAGGSKSRLPYPEFTDHSRGLDLAEGGPAEVL